MTDIYTYAALLLHKAGSPIDIDFMRAVLLASGAVYDINRIEAFVNSIKDVDIDDALSAMPVVSQPPTPSPSAPSITVETSGKETSEDPMGIGQGLSDLFGGN